MRAKEYFYFKGKASWAKLHQPDTKFSQWNIKVHLDNPSIELFDKLKAGDHVAAGILNEKKRDDDGDFVIFKRPTVRKWDNKDVPLSPPVVLDKNNQPFNQPIGNGSDVTVKVERYVYTKPFKQGKGSAIRLESCRVDNLVPYARKDMSDEEEKMIKGLDVQPIEHF